MPTFSPPVNPTEDGPTLPEDQTSLSYKLFRHFRSRPCGRNVYIYSNNTVSENDPDGYSTLYRESDRTSSTLANAPHVTHIFYGGHEDEEVTAAEAALLIAAGYTVESALTHAGDAVWLAGPADSYPTSNTNPQGESITSYGVKDFAMGPGKSAFFLCQTTDGWLHWGGQPYTVNVFRPTGLTLEAYSFNPTTEQFIRHIFSTTLGVTSIPSQTYHTVGGADIESTISMGTGANERVICSVGRPQNDWNLATYGIFPSYAVLKPNGAGAWQIDNALSVTSQQVYTTNPGAAGNVYRANTTPVTGEAYYDNRHPTEMGALSSGSHFVVGHYDDATGIGERHGAFSVLDSSMNLKNTYAVPNVTHPDDARLMNLKPRNTITIPTANIIDTRFLCIYDVGGTVPTLGTTNMLTLQGLTTESDFETTVGGYTSVLGSCFNTRDPAAAIDGGFGLRMQATAFASGMQNEGSNINVDVGCTYYLTAKVRAVTVARGCQIGFRYYNSSGAFISQAFGSLVTNNTSTATTVSATLVVPASAKTAKISMSVPTVTVGTSEKHDWDTVTCEITIGNAKPCFQEFSYNASTDAISAVSAPITLDNPSLTPEQVGVDELGNVYVFTLLNGIFNSLTQVFECTAGERSYAVAHPATTSAWLTGDGSTTTEWRVIAASSYSVANSQLGSNVGIVGWDNTNKRMLAGNPVSGMIAINRTGTAGAYSFTPHAHGLNISNVVMPTSVTIAPAKVIYDTARGCAWMTIRTIDSTAYPPAAPKSLDSYLIRIEV